MGGGGRGGWGWVLLLQDKFVLSRNLGYNTRRDRQVAKRSSDPRVAYPEVKVQVRDLVHCGYWYGYPGKIRFFKPQVASRGITLSRQRTTKALIRYSRDEVQMVHTHTRLCIIKQK